MLAEWDVYFGGEGRRIFGAPVMRRHAWTNASSSSHHEIGRHLKLIILNTTGKFEDILASATIRTAPQNTKCRLVGVDLATTVLRPDLLRLNVA